ncbi:uncharacterized protein LOC130214603 [Danio aesculapii]|uniref:uncharacterized protein LOC130214603 n=1 Tax=Danio aesculapii TaxID=1142201 RepID=UPI0024C08E99|nr:uncharacterized protein LOC130214603 [Danio aesculapii]
MKFSSRLLFGLLMSYLYLRGSSNFCVNQSPSSITVNEGESAQISCCWNTSTHSVKVVWYINETKLSDPKQELREHQIKSCSTLHLINILNNHTGHYVCEVTQDIPLLVKKNGTGTNVSVSICELNTTSDNDSDRSPDTKTTSTQNWLSDNILPLSLGSAIGLLTLCLAFSICKMRNCKKTERRVIHQTPHSEGEEHEHMEEEEGSTGSSRGSLQWYQVPVYWSYFDLRRGEEQ